MMKQDLLLKHHLASNLIQKYKLNNQKTCFKKQVFFMRLNTVSSEQVRNPMHSKLLRGWKNYEDLLEASMELISNNRDHKGCISQ